MAVKLGLLFSKNKKIMTLKETIEILESHNKWRKGADIDMTHPAILSEAVDTAIHLLKELIKNNKHGDN